jgi:hypothetical protein
LRIVLEEEGVEDLLGDVAVCGGKVGEGLEVGAEVVVDGALGLVEEEHIRADAEPLGEGLEHAEGGLGGAGLVAAELGVVDAYRSGELFLAEAPLCPGRRSPE